MELPGHNLMREADIEATAIPPLLLGRYRVERLLGEGGLGTVILAFDTRLKRTVAIKTPKRSLAQTDRDLYRAVEERFVREAEAGSRVGDHPNLVTVYDLVEDGEGSQYLINEYVPGGTVADRLAAGGALPLAAALRLTGEAARGLQAAHEAGIVHRDIKPANIFLAMDGRAQVGDFGIAQIDHLSARTHALVAHPGTPLYMSPEQAQTTGYVRAETDQYSLGLILFEMLTGRIYKRLRARDVDALLVEQPPEVAALIRRMAATDSDDRYDAMAAVIAAIRAIERTFPAMNLPLPPSPSRISDADPATARPTPVAALEVPVHAPRPSGPAAEAPKRDAAADSPPPLAPLALPLLPHRAAPRRRPLLIAAIAAVLVMGLMGGMALAFRGGITGGAATATGAVGAPPVSTATTVQGAALAPTAGPTETAAAQPLPATATAVPASPVPTATSAPTVAPSPTPVPPTPVPPTPAPTLGVFGVGTTRHNDLETIAPADATDTFTVGDEVFAFINYDGARQGTDSFAITLIANGNAQAPQSVTAQKRGGFQFVSLGKLDAGDYRIELRANGALVPTAPEFHVVAPPPPTATPVPVRVVPATAVPAAPRVNQPVSQPAPPVVQPAPPVVQPAPAARPTCVPGSC